MAKTRASKATSDQLLRRVGLWATIWWAVTGLYFVLVLWVAKDYYVTLGSSSVFNMQDWRYAIQQAGQHFPFLAWLLIFIILVWVIGAFVWLTALKQAKITYKNGLKDLFLTIR
jgi:hypothetical protein